jgi:hypothetical protein
MKVFILFSLLSFASTIAMIPSDGNMAIMESNQSHAYTEINNHTTNYDNSKHRPHLAIVENNTKKLLFSTGTGDADDTDEGEGRRLLRIFRHSAPARPPAPAPAPKAAPAPAPKAAPAPAPKAAPAPKPAPKAAPAPKPAPKAAPAPAPKAAPAPKPAPKAAPAPKPKPKPKSKSKKAPKAAPKPTPKPAPLVINKYSSVNVKLSVKTKELAKKFENAFATWVVTSEGQDAIKFCQSLGISNKQDIYNGCIEDMRVTKSKAIAQESALSAEEFISKAAANPSKRYCVASGDPHVTNYDGELFHIQEPGIYTVVRTPDTVFEIQEKMRKNGAIKPGVPSCMTGAVVHYKQMNIEVDVANFGKILVNGKDVELPEDFTLTFGGVQIRYGKQVIEWKGAAMQPAGLKLTTPNGFSVMISGGYCGVLETNVPTDFFGKMQGICGNADGVKSAADYAEPNGAVLNVNRGAKNWEMGGYNGPDSPVSKWQLSWKPHGAECYFAKECENGVQTRKAVAAPAPVVAPAAAIRVTPTVAPKATTDTKQTVVIVSPTSPKPEDKMLTKSSASSVSSVGVKSSSSSSSSTHSHKVCRPEVFPPVSPSSIAKHVATLSADAKSKMSDLYKKFKTMTDDMKKAHHDQFTKDKKVVTDTETKTAETYKKYSAEFTNAQTIMGKITALNVTLTQHHKILNDESSYLARLKIFKPKFLTSLDNVKTHVSGIKSDIHTTIVEGDDKKSLLSILDDVRASTDKSAALLAKAFMDHYDKYNKNHDTSANKYKEELDSINVLSDKYKVDVAKRDGLWKEYSDILAIAKKLKDSMSVSEKDEKTFDELMVRIAKAFQTNERKSDKKLSTPNTKCAADVLKAHVDHNRV